MANEPLRDNRGGCWDDQPSFARVALRNQVAPGNRGDYLGVRLVRVVNPLQQVAEMIDGK